jgi:hypothetical protein
MDRTNLLGRQALMVSSAARRARALQERAQNNAMAVRNEWPGKTVVAPN